ncbi:hypothetical protein F5884DRAFT_752320 [Xylogone sp. PMI_703]|nr:hypothetical protein F5884DRAFT_752320 [Xylogone sp. PMI_703]
MRTISFFTATAILATFSVAATPINDASASPEAAAVNATLVPDIAAQGYEVDLATCYCGQSCTTYAWFTTQFSSGQCVKLSTGYARAALPSSNNGGMWCAIYTDTNCQNNAQGVGGIYGNTCVTAAHGWANSFACFF